MELAGVSKHEARLLAAAVALTAHREAFWRDARAGELEDACSPQPSPGDAPPSSVPAQWGKVAVLLAERSSGGSMLDSAAGKVSLALPFSCSSVLALFGVS